MAARENLRIGATLKLVLEERGFGGKGGEMKAAKKLDIDQPTLNRWSRDETSPSTGQLRKLAEGLHVSTDLLLGLVPIAAEFDEYKARRPLLASPEFRNAPEPVQRQIMSKGEPSWSTVEWVRAFDRAMLDFASKNPIETRAQQEKRKITR